MTPTQETQANGKSQEGKSREGGPESTWSSQWCAVVAETFASMGVPSELKMRLRVNVGSGKASDLTVGWLIADGAVVVDDGSVDVPADVPVVEWTVGKPDATALLSGALEPAVAYMQGRLKVSGEMELVLQLLRWSHSPAFAESLRQLPVSA